MSYKKDRSFPILFDLTNVGGKNMKTLGLEHVFSATRLLMKIGVREEVRAVAKRAQEVKTKEEKMDMGFDLFFGIMEKAIEEKSEKEIYVFIADLFECDPDEVRTMKPLELFKKMEQVASVEEWKDFFGYVKRLIQKK